MDRLYSLQFFAANAKNCIIPLPPVDLSNSPVPAVSTDDAHYMWHPLMQRIEIMLRGHTRISNSGAVDLEPIQVLFVQTEHLTSKVFLDNLSGSQAYVAACAGKTQVALRQTRPTATGDENPAKPEQSKTIQKITLHPIITIGYPDITSIYEDSPSLDFETEALTRYWQDERKHENAWLYHLNLDRRVKFLDSSIWHRYVAYDKNFETNLKKILCQVIEYYDLRLYQSLAGLATLEFECRMLQNATIARYGDHGHHEVVTPFEFHSETAMERKAEKFLKFFETERNGTCLSNLHWNVLLVDDYADHPISSIDESADKDKRYLIEHWITEFNGDGSLPTHKRLNLEIKEYTKENNRVIGESIEFLQKQTFDIILLDYLLGDSELQKHLKTHDLKAYGHEFLLELATSPEQAKFRRGPFGRYWVFPISSFPFAFTEKLKQLNLDGSSERWYIANGGDPITTPALFRLNFYRLLLKQISECYLHEAALERWINRLNVIEEEHAWINAMQVQIGVENFRQHMLAHDARNKSAFANSMQEILKTERSSFDFITNLGKWLAIASSHNKSESIKLLIDELKELWGPEEQYKKNCMQIKEQIKKIFKDTASSLIKLIREKKDQNEPNIKYTNATLTDFPIDVVQIYPEIESLDLSNNMLSIIPPFIKDLKKLKSLNISDNENIVKLPIEALSTLKQLSELDIKNTIISKKINNGYAYGYPAVEKMLEDIKKSQAQVRIFISYSKKDIKWLKKIKGHFQNMIDNKEIDLWTDHCVEPGQDWDKITKEQLAIADIIFCLLSTEFINTSYIKNEEVPKAKSRHEKGLCEIIPIRVSEVDLENTIFDELQGLPRKKWLTNFNSSTIDSAILDIVKEVRKMVKSLRTPSSE